MGYKLQELRTKYVLCRRKTIGGSTYYVGRPGDEFEPVCMRHKGGTAETGFEFCGQPAGWRTENEQFGAGACKFHGGLRATSDKSWKYAESTLSSSRYAAITKRKLHLLYEQYSNDPKLMDLVPELALLRTMLAEAMKRYQSTSARADLELVLTVIRDVGTIIERIERIQNNQVLTASTARLLFFEALTLLKKYLPQESLMPFYEEWRANATLRGMSLPLPDKGEM